MDKVRDKLSALTDDFAEDLYYDKDEYDREINYERGFNAGSKRRNIEIAKSMLEENIPLETIIKITNLTEKEILKLKN